jgi:CRP/FNR family cyclic AMP-dependent transcriptional regulator
MEKYGKLVTLPEGEILVDSTITDPSFYYLTDGKLSVSLLSEDGRELLMNWLGKGAIIGDSMLLGNSNEYVTIKVERKSSAYSLDAKTFWYLMRSDSEFSITIAKHVSSLYTNAMGHLESFAYSPCKDRLYSLLLDQSEAVEENQGWRRLRRSYTHQQLAQLVGANRVTVSRVLSQLCNEEKIRLLNRKMEIKKI